MSAASEVTKRKLLAWLTKIAAAGQACPTNAVICERLGIKSPSGPAYILDGLERAGLVRVARSQNARIVTIVATGQSTAGTLAKAEHVGRGPAKSRVSAAVMRAAKVDGRDLPSFVTALIEMGLECWRDDRAQHGELAA